MNFYKMIRTTTALILMGVILMMLAACGNKNPDSTNSIQPTTLIDIPEDDVLQTAFLGNNLYITNVGDYTGAYMEDGSDEIVTNVLMIILKNESKYPLQLARINLEYSDFTAKFEATNVPAGESVVLLEKERHEFVSENYLRATAENVVFFQQPMELQEDKVKITGSNGSLKVENLTDQDLGEIYIYYKNSAVDGLFYGGITYLVRVKAGLKPGQNATVLAGHYYTGASSIIDVKILPLTE